MIEISIFGLAIILSGLADYVVERINRTYEHAFFIFMCEFIGYMILVFGIVYNP